MEKMLTKRQKRLTKHIRISKDIHKCIRILALEKGLTASKLIDTILLENSEVNSWIISKSKEIKKHDKEIKKIILNKTEQTVKEFNKITF
jgi:hypothetical protein